MSTARRLAEPPSAAAEPREASPRDPFQPELVAWLRESFRAEHTARGRIEASLRTLLAYCAAKPDAVRALVELGPADDDPAGAPNAALAPLREIVESTLGTLAIEPERRHQTVGKLVGAVDESIRVALTEGTTDRLPAATGTLLATSLAQAFADEGASLAPVPAGHSRPRPDQIAAGYHGLSQTEVLRSQGERILRATVEAIGAFGYPATRLEDITELAGVSRKTVYKLYGSKELCLLSCHERATAQLTRLVAAACEGLADWPNRLRAALGALLEALAWDPNGARLCFVEMLTAGPEPLRRRDRALDALATIIGDGSSGEQWPRPLVRVGFAGGLGEILQREIAAGRTALLPRLAPELVYTLTLPIAGPKVAQRQLELAAKR